MNERIRELAEQSLPNVKFWNEEITKGNTPPKNRAITLDELEKFAELIVEECRYVMDCNKGSDQHTEWNRALFETSEKIKEHFGVENA